MSATFRRPSGPSSRRAVPRNPTPEQREALRDWLQREDRWIMRPVWDRWLEQPDDALMVPMSALTHDQYFAAQAWLEQQRHGLHNAVEGGPAPEGWLESLPLYRGLLRTLGSDAPATERFRK